MKKRIITAALAFTLTLSATLSVFAAPASTDHSRDTSQGQDVPISTKTTNTYVDGDNVLRGSVSFEQAASWADSGKKSANLSLKFSGLEYVKTNVQTYDYVVMMDGSGSTGKDKTINSILDFAKKVYSITPDAHFTVINNGGSTEHKEFPKGKVTESYDFVHIRNAKSYEEVESQLTFPYSTGNAVDNSEVAYEAAYDLWCEHTKSDHCNNKLVVVNVGDADLCSWPQCDFNLDTTYNGDRYQINFKRYDCTGSMWKYKNHICGNICYTSGEFSMLKNGIDVGLSENLVTAFRANDNNLTNYAIAKMLYYRDNIFNRLDSLGVIRSYICTSAGVVMVKSTANPQFKYMKDIYASPGFFMNVINKGTDAISAGFTLLSEKLKTKPVSMSTSINSKYFKVDEAELTKRIAEKPNVYFTVKNAKINGEAVQNVSIQYNASDSQSVIDDIQIPLIPSTDAVSVNNFIPVVLDNGNTWSARCEFTSIDSPNTVEKMSTDKVWLPAADYMKMVVELSGIKALLYSGDSSVDLMDLVAVNGKPAHQYKYQDKFSKVKFTVKRIEGFEKLPDYDVVTLNNLNATAQKSGIVEITASYDDIPALGRIVLVVPGDIDKNGKVDLNDAVLESELLNPAVRETKLKNYGTYGLMLANMNNLENIDVDDIVKIVSMVNKTSTYYN